jgi:hypothetical protein
MSLRSYGEITMHIVINGPLRCPAVLEKELTLKQIFRGKLANQATSYWLSVYKAVYT